MLLQIPITPLLTPLKNYKTKNYIINSNNYNLNNTSFRFSLLKFIKHKIKGFSPVTSFTQNSNNNNNKTLKSNTYYYCCYYYTHLTINNRLSIENKPKDYINYDKQLL